MNLLSEEDKLLYDSCDIFAHMYLCSISTNKHGLKTHVECNGDENIQELCNRCPFYASEE